MPPDKSDSHATIIFVDDKPSFRSAILDGLSEFPGIECIGEAGNGRELLRLLRSQRPDVILLDLEMPVMDGNEAMSEVMALYPDSKILVISFHAESELVEDYMRRGAKGYISKDAMSDVAVLAGAIRTIQQGGTYLQPAWEKKRGGFTPRQIQMIPMICDGMTNREIAEEFGINVRSVEKQKQKLYHKTNSASPAAFLKYAFRKGLDFLERKKAR